MPELFLDADSAKAAVIGGTLLGGGGGGPREMGFALSRLAIEAGRPKIVSIDDLNPDAILITVGLVGSPASKSSYVEPVHYVRAVELLADQIRQPIAGAITNENGGVGTVNGWFQAVILGIPLVDAPCNGRAHPTGVMGSMGLDLLENYLSFQAFAGGGGRCSYVEGVVRGQLTAAAGIIRAASVAAGGLVAVARNPVAAQYVKKHGAPGAIREAIEVGELVLRHQASGGRPVAEACAAYMGGHVLIEGRVTECELATRGGFDIGVVIVSDGNSSVRLTFWNEYMTADIMTGLGRRNRLATFPDLIATLDRQSGWPMTTAEICEGSDVVVLVVPRSNLKLGSTMKRRDLLEEIERVTGETILEHLGQL